MDILSAVIKLRKMYTYTYFAGQYMLNVLDYYVASWSLLLTAFLEVALIAYIYGQ